MFEILAKDLRRAARQTAHRLRHGIPDAELRPWYDERSLLIYGVIATYVTMGFLLLYKTGIRFEGVFWRRYLSWPVAAIICGFLLRRTGSAKLSNTMELLGLVYGQGLLSFLVIIPLLRLSASFADAALSHGDVLLGFNWVSFEQLSHSSESILDLAYRSFTWQPLLIIVGLAVLGEFHRSWVFVTAAAVALAMTSAIFPLAPAQGPYAYFGIEPTAIVAKHWTADVLPVLSQFKSQATADVPALLLTGVVAFPSYHAAGALIFIWAAWPMKVLRWPLAVVNVLMFLGSLTVGCHYLTDLLAGVAIGAVSLAVSAVFIGAQPFGQSARWTAINPILSE